MTRWYQLERTDAGFLDTAPHIYRYQKRFAAPPAQVWESLASDDSIAAWTSAIKSITWLSPRPFGVGTTREVASPGLGRVRERFSRWDEGQGYSFEVYESTMPTFRRFAEDYNVVADGDGTIFTWVVAIEPKSVLSLPFKALSPVVKSGFGKVVVDGQRFFADKR